MQLRQLIIARPLCGNRPSHEMARRYGREERNKPNGTGERGEGGRGRIRRIPEANFQSLIRLFTLCDLLFLF